MSANSYDETVLVSSGCDLVGDCKMVEDQPNWLDQEVVREKRLRSSSDDILDEDGFTTVRSKRSAKVSKMTNSVLSSCKNEEENLPDPEEQIIVSITGKEILPKQFKMAKLLRAETILNIISIKYKSPFKIILEFDNKESAQKLLECRTFIDMGFRCQLLNDMTFSYGIIRNVDIDIQDQEIKDNLESDLEIVFLRRLKRMTSTGKWVESETIRIGFKGSILPSYVHGYGCRFKVEPYMYPVTQCTGCWKFGHSIRFCPNRKIRCPKCTDFHPNCEISCYKCVNCKGNHMALDKSCPVFLKEKTIRIIMRDMNYTYKKALSIYLKENQPKKTNEQMKENFTRNEPETENNKPGRSYRDVLINQTDTDTEEQESSEEEMQQRKVITGTKQRAKQNKKSKKQNKSYPKVDRNINTEGSDADMFMEDQDVKNKCNEKTKSKKKKKVSEITFMKFIQKLKDIFMSDVNLDVKIERVGNNDICTWFLSKLNYG